MTLPLAHAGALAQRQQPAAAGTLRIASALRTSGRRLSQAAAGGTYEQASAMAAFASQDKSAVAGPFGGLFDSFV